MVILTSFILFFFTYGKRLIIHIILLHMIHSLLMDLYKHIITQICKNTLCNGVIQPMTCLLFCLYRGHHWSFLEWFRPEPLRVIYSHRMHGKNSCPICYPFCIAHVNPLITLDFYISILSTITISFIWRQVL